MRIVKYTLNEDGSIPLEIVNGGFFPVDNGGVSPQDLTMLGWTNDESFGEDVADLKAYLLSIGAENWTNRAGEPVDLDLLVADFLETGQAEATAIIG